MFADTITLAPRGDGIAIKGFKQMETVFYRLTHVIISSQTEMTGDIADTDELLVSDSGTTKADFSVERCDFYRCCGDAKGMVLTVVNNAVTTAKILDENVVPK